MSYIVLVATALIRLSTAAAFNAGHLAYEKVRLLANARTDVTDWGGIRPDIAAARGVDPPRREKAQAGRIAGSTMLQ